MAALRECETSFDFAGFKTSGEFSDVVVVGPSGEEFRCHGLLLAYHSEFFRRALLANLREGTERRVTLKFDDAFDVWPTLLNYFYDGQLVITEQNAMGLLSLSKQLLVPKVESEAREFIKERLTAKNCVDYLRQAVQCGDVELKDECIGLAAQGFHTAYSGDTSGFPPSIILDILTHPDLDVQCEEQVLAFVLYYVRSTQLESDVCRELFQQVRLPYLPNQCFGELQGDPIMPRDLLAEGALARLTIMSGEGSSRERSLAGGSGNASLMMQWVVRHASPASPTPVDACSDAGGSCCEASSASCWGGEGDACCDSPYSVNRGGSGGGAIAAAAEGEQTPGRCRSALSCSSPATTGVAEAALAASGFPPPRPSYCSTLVHGLPGGCRYVDLPCEHVWEDLVESMRVQVSGVLEGRPRNVLSAEPDAFFSTNDSEHPQASPWVEVHLPANASLLSLTHYTFTHGHNRASYYRMRSWKTQAGTTSSVVPGSTFVNLDTKYDTCVDLTRKGPAREQFTVVVRDAQQPPLAGWRVVRLVSTGSQQDGVRRLCLKGLRLHGVVRLDLLKQGEGMPMSRPLLEKALAAVGGQYGNSAV